MSVFPKISFLLGVFLTLFIFFTRNNLGKNKFVRYFLGAVTLIYSLLSLDTFTTANKHKLPIIIWFSSYFLFSFVGFLFYRFTISFIKKRIDTKKWVVLLIVFSVIKSIFFFYYHKEVDRVELITESKYLRYYEIEFMNSCLVNLYFFHKASLFFRRKNSVIYLSEQNEVYFNWMNLLLKANVFLMLIILLEVILAWFNFSLLPSLFKIEPIIYTLFFFVLVYSLMYFPVFALTGDYKDLDEKEKYKHSSLSNSSELFKKIDDLVTTEKLYLSQKLKMNIISETLCCPLPYVSQAINENKEMSFTDYINSYRIEEAKKKLLVNNPDTIFAIAIDVGFNSKAAFYNAFKKLTNLTPTQFRKENLA